MLPRALQDAALQWQIDGRPGVVVEVAQAQGSVPRGVGTRMLVGLEVVLGTIGGGHLELQAIARARGLLGGSAVEAQRLALGPSLGQCCGGVVELRYTPLALAQPKAWSLPAPRFHLDLYGAGHVGRALVQLLAGIDCRLRWIDARAEEFPSEPSPPHIERLCSDDPEAEVASTPPGALALVLTHDHDLDLRLVEALLRRPQARWVGLIGSASKAARFRRRLQAKGLDDARLHCPIGLPGIEGKEPPVIAVAIAAQLLSFPQDT